MRKQKIIKVGNSLAVTLPASFVKEGNLKVGDEIVVETAPQYQTALIKPIKTAHKTRLTPEFFSWLEEITITYKDVIQELAKK